MSRLMAGVFCAHNIYFVNGQSGNSRARQFALFGKTCSGTCSWSHDKKSVSRHGVSKFVWEVHQRLLGGRDEDVDGVEKFVIGFEVLFYQR